MKTSKKMNYETKIEYFAEKKRDEDEIAPVMRVAVDR